MCCQRNSDSEREKEEGLAPWIIGVIYACAVLLFAGVAWLAYAFTHHPNI